jgi:AraC family transcriptional regulator, chitin signaling transcriptional activator
VAFFNLKSFLLIFSMRKLLMAFWGIFFFVNAYGQDFKVYIYKKEHGLPTTKVKNIAQDEKGYVWLATDQGMVRYDGTQFLTYSDSISSRFIKFLFKRTNGDFLVLHDQGVTKIDHQDGEVGFKPYFQDDFMLDGINAFPKQCYEDHYGRLWIAEFRSVSMFYKGAFKRHVLKKSGSESFLRSFHFFEDHRGRLMVISYDGDVFRYEEEKESFRKVGDLGINGIKVNGLVDGHHGELWAATNFGLLRINTHGRNHDFSGQYVVKLPYISCIARVNENIFLLGTLDQGLYQLSFLDHNPLLVPLNKVDFSLIHSIKVMEDQSIWVSSDEGVALLQPNIFKRWPLGSDNSCYNHLVSLGNKVYMSNGQEITVVEVLKDNYHVCSTFHLSDREYVMSMAGLGKKVYFTTSSHRLYSLEEGRIAVMAQNLKGKVTQMCAGQEGNLWMHGLDLEGVVRFHIPTRKVYYYGQDKAAPSRVTKLKIGPNGEVFCAGEEEQLSLYQYNQSKDAFEKKDVAISLDEKWEYPVDFDFYGYALLISANHGLVKYNYDSGAVTKVMSNQPFQVKSVWTGESIFLGTKEGLVELYEDGTPILYDEFSGLPALAFLKGSFVKDISDRLWIGSSNGVWYADLQKVPVRKTPIPEFYAIKVNGKNIQNNNSGFTDKAVLQASFGSISFPGHSVEYKYRIRGVSDDWIKVGKNEDIIVSNIPKGDYVLEIKALQKGRYVWSDPLIYGFSVKKVWYLSWWSGFLWLSLLGLLVYWFIKLNLQRITKEKEFLERTVSLRTMEINARNQKILQQKKELEALNSTKDKLFSIVAHDLRSPLSLMAAFSNLLISDKQSMDKGDIQRVALNLQLTVNNTILLADNLLMWAESQMKSFKYNPQVILVERVLRANIIMLKPVAQNKGIQIVENISPEVKVLVDKDQFSLVVRNLLTNAIKFTHPGGKIEVKLKPSGDMAELVVTDTGVGLSKEKQAGLFDVANKVSSKGTQGEKGTGLGLMLCKEFIEKNKGKIYVESVENGGSSFFVILPLAYSYSNPV